MTEPFHVRATNDDREAVADFLGSAFQAGQLNVDEYQDRMDTAHQVTYVEGFEPLFEGLFTPGTSFPDQLERAQVPSHQKLPTTVQSTTPTPQRKTPTRATHKPIFALSDTFYYSGVFLGVLGVLCIILSAAYDNGWVLLGTGVSWFGTWILTDAAEALYKQGR